MTKHISLKRYKVSEDIFNNILTSQKKYVEQGNVDDYRYGYKNKRKIIYNGLDCFICREMFITPELVGADWRQVFVLLDRGLKPGTFTKDIQGNTAWNKMTKLIKKYYTDEEFEQILSSHSHEVCKPIHFNPSMKLSDKIVLYKNCYKYDINSAYCSAYITIFPKAKEDILKIYNERKIHPENKKILNYFNGMLKHKGYDGTYYWVVNRTNEILQEALKSVGGIILYINTDGFIVKDPDKPLIHSLELGKFKEEYQGDVYIYVDKNYFLIQTGDEFTGNCLLEARKGVDLSKGVVAHYDRCRELLSDSVAVYLAKNIELENIEIE